MHREHLADAEWIGISVITKLEFLCFDGLTESDKTSFLSFCDRVDVVNLSDSDKAQVAMIVDLRRRYKLKLPDAVLITADAHFEKVSELGKTDPLLPRDAKDK